MTLNTITHQLTQQIQTPALTAFSKFIAIITEPLFLLTLAIIISIFLYLKKQKSQAILLASTSIATAFLIKILKNIFQIPRPISNLITETGYSFPSGHTTFAIIFFGLMVYLFTKHKKTKAISISAIIVTVIISTRLYLQVHWLTDIIAGIILGTTILILSILTHKKSTSSS